MAGHPGTIYGVYKRANESTAAVYLAENGISSTGLRPHTVYGVGRDQGVTSAPTTAMLAAAAGTALHDPVRRRARSCSSRATSRARSSPRASPGTTGAAVHNLPGRRVSIEEIVATLGVDSIGFDDVRLPFPEEVDSASFTAGFPDFAETPLADGVAATVDRFRALLAEGLVQPPSDARSLMSNQSFRDDWQTRFGRREPKVVCVGLNYSDHTGESQMEPPKAPLLFGKFANTLCGDGDAIVLPDGVGHVDARGRAGGRDRPHGERRVAKDDALEFVEGWTCANDVSAPRLPVRRRPVVPRQEPRHVLPGRPARRAARRARLERPADPAAAERRDAAGLAHEPADLRHPDARLVRQRGAHARARRPDPDRHARGRRRLPRAEGRARAAATSSRSRSRGSACCGTTFVRRERTVASGRVYKSHVRCQAPSQNCNETVTKVSRAREVPAQTAWPLGHVRCQAPSQNCNRRSTAGRL